MPHLLNSRPEKAFRGQQPLGFGEEDRIGQIRENSSEILLEFILFDKANVSDWSWEAFK